MGSSALSKKSVKNGASVAKDHIPNEVSKEFTKNIPHCALDNITNNTVETASDEALNSHVNDACDKHEQGGKWTMLQTYYMLYYRHHSTKAYLEDHNLVMVEEVHM